MFCLTVKICPLHPWSCSCLAHDCPDLSFTSIALVLHGIRMLTSVLHFHCLGPAWHTNAHICPSLPLPWSCMAYECSHLSFTSIALVLHGIRMLTSVLHFHCLGPAWHTNAQICSLLLLSWSCLVLDCPDMSFTPIVLVLPDTLMSRSIFYPHCLGPTWHMTVRPRFFLYSYRLGPA